ncbi:ABC transporter permease [Mesorhizobium sp. NPDC059025]|uniref:ABC transporter permease n=1 Tax=unclassified Mesorhizobium TaxID=325217 RepID=UPI0036AF95A0
MMQLLRRSSPLVVLAIGQLLVIVSGGFDLSVGSLITFVILLSALLLNTSPEMVYPCILLSLAIGLASGAANGLVVSVGKVPSIIATLGMLLMLRGAGFYFSGGSARGNLPDTFRWFGRESILGFPVALLVVIAFAAVAWFLLHNTSFGRQLYMVGANARAARLSGVNVAGVRIVAFMFSGLSAAIAAILLGGFSGVSTAAGAGYELQAISAAVLGGAVLLGGRGSVLPVIAGALALNALFTLLNIWGFPKPLRDVVQGLIIICAVAYSARRK